MTSKKKLAVWKFSSCDGCQLSLLDCEDEILKVADSIQISQFLEATRHYEPGPYDLSIVEGSITTAEEKKRIHEVRKQSRYLVTIGACATAGGIQALKNFKDVSKFISIVYATPRYISTLNTSTAISEHVHVDFELRGCPINKFQLLEVIAAFLNHRKPRIKNQSVCYECKLNGTVCIMVSQGIPCAGPITHSGCGAICPSFDRGCYSCYGPKENCNIEALKRQAIEMGLSPQQYLDLIMTYNSSNPILNLEVKNNADRKEK